MFECALSEARENTLSEVKRRTTVVGIMVENSVPQGSEEHDK